jgi:hypothetical protein
MIYKATLDNLAKGVTIVISVLFPVIIGIQFFYNSLGNVIPIYTAVGLALIYFITYVFRPINYQILADKLVIHRTISDVKIERSEIKSVELLEKEMLNSTIRVFGVGGLFGYYGKFTNSKMGMMTWYATRRDKAVMVITISGKKIIITPDEPVKFVENWDEISS